MSISRLAMESRRPFSYGAGNRPGAVTWANPTTVFGFTDYAIIGEDIKITELVKRYCQVPATRPNDSQND